jgi:metal-sulfur cluster biosynthetic enzyme
MAPPGGIDLLLDGASEPVIRELLHAVIDPELGLDIVELGLLRHVSVRDGVAHIVFTVTTPACPLANYIEDQIRECLWQLPDVKDIEIEVEYEPAWRPEDMSDDAKVALGWEQ